MLHKQTHNTDSVFFLQRIGIRQRSYPDAPQHIMLCQHILTRTILNGSEGKNNRNSSEQECEPTDPNPVENVQ